MINSKSFLLTTILVGTLLAQADLEATQPDSNPNVPNLPKAAVNRLMDDYFKQKPVDSKVKQLINQYNALGSASNKPGTSSPDSLNGTPYLGRESPSVLATPKDPQKRTPERLTGVRNAIAVLDQHRGVWDMASISSDKDIVDNLDKFDRGEIGQDIKKLKLGGLTPEAIHATLMSKGFSYIRTPLQVSGSPADRYWSRDGTITKDKNNPNTVPMDIYYKDQQVVRVKPEGIPDPKNPAPQPQASKSITRFPVNKADPLSTLTWANELFKVTEAGAAIPKGPSEKYGFVMLHSQEKIRAAGSEEAKKRLEDENKAYIDYIMRQTHLNIPTPANDNNKR